MRLDLFAVHHDQAPVPEHQAPKNFALEAAVRVGTDGEVDQISREINGAAASLCSRPPSDRPPAPVNVSVTHLRSDSATVSWEVPEGDIIIGFSILQQVRSSPPPGDLFPIKVKVQSERLQNKKKNNVRGVSDLGRVPGFAQQEVEVRMK